MSDVIQSLLSDLVSCAIAPGDPVLEVKAAERYSTSRTKIREALITLSCMGLVNLVPNKGAVAAPLDPAVVFNVFEARIALEKAAAALAAARITESESERLAWYLDEIDHVQAAWDREGLFAIERQVFAAIREQSRNPMIADQLANLRNHATRCWNYYRERGLEEPADFGALRQIVKTVANREPDLASAAMHLYLLASLKAFQDMLSKETEVLKWV